jgi:signal transduction histidine kinase
MVMLAARRPGPLDDEALLERFGAQIATALDHAAMYEASYLRERDLEELDARRREFIGALAHEVRTPLTSIQAFAELLQLQPVAMDDTAEQLVSSLEHGVRRLNQLVNDLLDLGRGEAVGFSVTPEVIELPPLFAEIELLLSPAYLLREQLLTFEIGEGASRVVADRARLEQVLLNLLSNANRHTPPRGEVVARARQTEQRRLRIEVEDSGAGVPPEERERIFDPYYRVEQRDQPVHGSGLGLAVARQLVELQHGRIWVEGREGGGSRFCVELPLPADAPPATPGGRDGEASEVDLEA